ncbi:hypothetical protein [Leptospira kmetyi]|uniref:Lipoprotein n=1 Tax=Leptospira kmetyi TaxID=408139 RepID=A0ABX4N645_9LEPT|nr:hypothetical protein [Leptospira kmetyi]PJZ28779.1 hypothetical protein CH378_16415 [Leptospira kmetyi]PJZ39515.1 hypothetical protein CH370_20895 [Leptospira kmetyi]
MFTLYKLLLIFALLTLVSCEELKKNKEEEAKITDPEAILLLGFGVNLDTLIRVENQRDVPITMAFYDNSGCNPNSAPARTGLPVVYDFGTIPAHSKSIILTIPFTKTNLQSVEDRRIALYPKMNAYCDTSSYNFFMSFASNQFGYLWKVIPDSPTMFHFDFEVRQGSLAPPNLE